MRQACVSLAVVLGAAMFGAPTVSRAQQNATQILDRAIEALGGAAYREVRDVTATGRVYQFQRGELIGLEVFRDYIKFPDKERTEFGKDGNLVRVNNGSEGWNINDGEVEAQREEQVEVFWEEFKVSLDYLLRFAIHRPESTLQYIGREMIDFKRADVVEIRDEDRTRIDLYIDRESGFILKKTVRRLDDPRVHEEVYSNYHLLQSVMTPLLIDRYTDGVATNQIRIDEIIYNSDLSDQLFSESLVP
jgi:hypothetical protein